MRLFIDSSDFQLWQLYRRMGWAYGATTNPLILKRDGRKCSTDTYSTLLSAADDVGLQELQIQATGDTRATLYQSGMEIAALADKASVDVVIKIPLTQAGLEAATMMARHEVRITMTAGYAAHQMMAAMAIGADYIAPYYGRLLEAKRDADKILQAMLDMKGTSKSPRILVASIRSIAQLEELAARGHNTFTLAPDIASQFSCDPMSDAAAADFEKARMA